MSMTRFRTRQAAIRPHLFSDLVQPFRILRLLLRLLTPSIRKAGQSTNHGLVTVALLLLQVQDICQFVQCRCHTFSNGQRSTIAGARLDRLTIKSIRAGNDGSDA